MKTLSRSQRRAKKMKAAVKGKRIGTRRTKPAIKIYPDGREVCNLKTAAGRLAYEKRLEQMIYRQHGECGCGCGCPLVEPTFDHEEGRGSGGSRRDDRIWKAEKPYNRALNYGCNILKGSVRGYGN